MIGSSGPRTLRVVAYYATTRLDGALAPPHSLREEFRMAYTTIQGVATGWPCRLFEVTGRPARGVPSFNDVVCLVDMRLARELHPAWQVFGPEGQHVAALIERAQALTDREAATLVVGHADLSSDTADHVWWTVAANPECRAVLNLPVGTLGRRQEERATRYATQVVAAVAVRQHLDRTTYLSVTGRWAGVIGRAHPED